jgi:hypothetical protein
MTLKCGSRSSLSHKEGDTVLIYNQRSRLIIAWRHRVQLVRFPGIVTSAELEALDKAASEFAVHNGSRFLLVRGRLSDVGDEKPETWPHTLADARAQGQHSSLDVRAALARLFVTEQHIGAEPPEIVSSIEAVFERLGVTVRAIE